MDLYKELICGTVAGVTQIVVGFPLDSIKVRYINSHQNDLIKWSMQSIKQEGLLFLYKGSLSPLICSSIHHANIFLSYHYFHSLFNKYNVNSLFSGFLAGIPITLTETPIDLLKCQFQIYSHDSYYNFIKAYGLTRLYRGFTATLIRNIPSFGLYFACYEYLTEYFQLNVFMSGVIAGFAFWGVTYPLDYIKTVIQSDSLVNPCNKHYINYWSHMNFRTVYRGYLPCITRSVIVNPFIFTAYNYSKKMLD